MGLFDSGFLIVWRISFLEKWKLTNEFSIGNDNCDNNTLLPAKKGLKILLFSLK